MSQPDLDNLNPVRNCKSYTNMEHAALERSQQLISRRKARISNGVNRRQFLRFAAGAAAAAIISPAGCRQGVAASKPALNEAEGPKALGMAKPNIILIMADDLGYECLGCYGSASYKTPVLDELARTGMRFEHCYSQPLCTPSRTKIMTGKSNA